MFAHGLPDFEEFNDVYFWVCLTSCKTKPKIILKIESNDDNNPDQKIIIITDNKDK